MSTFSLTVKQLKLGVLRKVGEPVDGSSIYDKNGDVMDLINRAHLKVLSGGNEFIPQLARPWTWANPQKFILELLPPYSTGAVSVTNGSATITFDTPPAYSMTGWWFRIIGRPEWFKILAHTASVGTATIDCSYTDVTGTALAFVAVKLEYTLNPASGILRVIGPAIVYRPQDNEGDNESKIYMTDESPMMKDWPMSQLQQKTPTRFCETTKDTLGNTGAITVRFNSYPQSTTKVEVPYIPHPDTLIDTPTYPFFATITIAAPGVLTYAKHGLVLNDPVVLSTTGALPTGFVAGTTYYIKNPTTNTFSLAASVGGGSITTSGSQSGTHTVTPAQPATYALVPQDHVEILEYIAAAWLCPIKNDERAQYYEQKAVLAGNALMGAYQKERTESSKDRGKLIPRQDTYYANKKYTQQEVTPGGSS